MPLVPILQDLFVLNFNQALLLLLLEGKPAMASYHLKMVHLYSIAINFQMNNYHYILLNYTLASLGNVFCIVYLYIFFISLMQSVNGAQFLIVIFFLLFGTAAFPVFLTVR